ncbi:MAG: prepilin-type N-terminal cleavage/methylation domain-containing protein [Candidatus Paceibacterota bacterium]|jgi:prepilin-type N-terminal cleavage/methylation domain-containing protein
MKKYFKQNNKGFTRTPKFGVTPKGGGFTLVETLVAISIFSVSIVALMTILGSGISNTNYAKTKIIASYLAQEGIEYVRNMRDSYVLYTGTTSLTWNSFIAKLSPCSAGNSCGFDTSVSLTNPASIFLCSTHINQCKLYVNNGNYNTNSSGVYSGFTRTIQATTVSANEIKISSTVSWTQGSGSYSIVFSENLFNWTE